MSARNSSLRRKLLFSLVTFLIVFSFAEWLAYRGGRMLDGRVVFYRAGDASTARDYLNRRHPVLGWPPPADFGSKRYDVSGSRPTPAFPVPGHACISLYGDSFTYGSGVSDEMAWPNQLSRLLGCRVANYGVVGYGSDQAAIRFERNLDDEASIVVLSHLSENIMRNVNQYRKLLAASGRLSLKPRYILDANGALTLVPLQIATVDKFAKLVERPEDLLQDEFFLPGGASGVTRLRFPFTLSMVRGLGHFHVRAELAGEPAYAQFYEEDHPAQGVEITARILELFARNANERGKLAMLQIIPTGLDLIEYQQTGEWTYAPLLERAAELELDVVDQGSRLMAWIGDGDPCQFNLACNNHMNAKGNRMLARLVAAALEERLLRQLAETRGLWPHPLLSVPRAKPRHRPASPKQGK